MTPIIEFKNYTFKYRSQSEPTLRDIDLRVNPGEKVLIVGPSWSGKSTLVHCINGMVPFSYSVREYPAPPYASVEYCITQCMTDQIDGAANNGTKNSGEKCKYRV